MGWVPDGVGWYRGVWGLQGDGRQCAPNQDAEIKGSPIRVPATLSTPPSHLLCIKEAGGFKLLGTLVRKVFWFTHPVFGLPNIHCVITGSSLTRAARRVEHQRPGMWGKVDSTILPWVLALTWLGVGSFPSDANLAHLDGSRRML